MLLLGLAFAVGASAADNPALPPLSAVLQRDTYDLVDELPNPVIAPDPPPGSGKTLLWGYEANFGNARILSYDISTGAPGQDCVPDLVGMGLGDPTGNGRGVAYDPLDGNLWITRLDSATFVGDGLIHKVIPPNATPTPGMCPQVTVIPFGDGPLGLIQDDIGALDLDQGSKHIWAAGYAPISVGGGALRNYFYLVDRNNGKILQSCFIPANLLNGAGFNDSLSYARLPGLPGSGQYLLTDGGERFQAPLQVIDTASCHDAKQATVVATFSTTHGLTGIDFESPGLLSSDPNSSTTTAISRSRARRSSARRRPRSGSRTSRSAVSARSSAATATTGARTSARTSRRATGCAVALLLPTR